MSARRPRTSCHSCRIARLGCDVRARKGAACSNCQRRHKTCDQDAAWVDGDATLRDPGDSSPAENARSLQTNEPQAHATRPSPSLARVETIAFRRLQATLLNDILWDIYFSIFEGRYATWLGNSCQPYLDTEIPKTSITRTVLRLDSIRRDGDVLASHPLPSIPSVLLQEAPDGLESSVALNNALRYAIYAFAVRWLPIRNASGKVRRQSASPMQPDRDVEVQACVWHQAKQAISAALTQPSYTSVLALIVFTITEMPVSHPEPGLYHLCTYALFGHLSLLRSPSTWRFHRGLSRESPQSFGAPLMQPSLMVYASQTTRDAEHEADSNSIYWLCVMIGCNRAVLQQLPSPILPSYVEGGKTWDFIRQRTKIFDQSFHTLRNSPDTLPPGVAEVVIEHASACKTMYFGTINQLCDSLFHHESSPVQKSAQCVLDESTRFWEVFEHLLGACARDYLSLSTASRLNYLLLICHYHMGTLVMADVLDSLDIVLEPLRHPALSRSRACRAITNALSLSMNSDRFSNQTSLRDSTLLHDPTPELMVEVLFRTGNAILLMYDAGEMAVPTSQAMLSIISSALEMISAISKKAAAVLTMLRKVCAERNLEIINNTTHELKTASDAKLEVPDGQNPKFIKYFLQEMEIQAASDLDLFENTVDVYEQRLMANAEKTGQ